MPSLIPHTIVQFRGRAKDREDAASDKHNNHSERSLPRASRSGENRTRIDLKATLIDINTKRKDTDREY